MTFTFENRFDLRPTHFSTVPLMKTEVAPANCKLFLRAYDVECLVRLLMDRNIVVRHRLEREAASRASGDIIRHPVTSYLRNQNRAKKMASYWWRDPHAFVSRGLLALCAVTQNLDPFARTANPRHPSHREYSPRPRPLTPAAQALAWPWYRALKRDHELYLRETDPANLPLEIPFFPFKERDGSRFVPYEGSRAYSPTDSRTGPRMGLIDAWLPRCVIERLGECGANFRDEGKFGTEDPTGKFYPLNRAAAVRRLLEALARCSAGVDPSAPFAFRGVELTKDPPSLQEAAAYRAHRHTMRRQIIEADVRRALATEHAPRGYPALMDSGAAFRAQHDGYGGWSATRQREALVAWGAEADFHAQLTATLEAGHTAVPRIALPSSAPIVPAGTTASLQPGTLREFNTSLNLKTGEFSTQIVEQPKVVRNKTRAPRKVRAASIDKPFNADELG